MTEAKVRDLVRKGALLINLRVSPKLTFEEQETATRIMRENVAGLHRHKKEVQS